MASFLRKYGVETTIEFPVPKLDDTDFAATGDWTPAVADIKISKDGGNVANCDNAAAAVGGAGSVLWSLTLTATEMQAARITLQIVDAALENQAVTIETYGHASAQHAMDFDDAVRGGMTALPNAAAEAAGGLYTRGSGAGQINQANNGETDANATRWAGTATSAGVGGDGLPASIALADRNAFLVESLKGGHTYQGNHYYVDPVNGDTHGNGNRGGRTDPYKTLQDCHDNAVTDSNHDVIFLLAGAAAGVTTHTIAGTTTFSKRYLSVRGPGRDFIITRTGSGDTLAVTADGVELSGFQLGTAATGSGHGIKITDADFVKVEHVWILDTRGDGVHILRGSNCVINLNTFQGTGVAGSGDGVHIVGTAGVSTNNRITSNVFSETVGDSILIEQGTTNDTLIRNNLIHDSGGWAINIGASSTDAIVDDNRFGNNASGDINDGGTTTIEINNEQWGTATALAALNDLSSADVIAALEDAGLVLQTTTIATLASQTSFTLTAGSADDGAYVGCIAVIEDGLGATQKAVGIISAYTGASKTVTLEVDPGIFTVQTNDKIAILPARWSDIILILADTNEIQGKLPTNKFMGSSDGADDDGTLDSIETDTQDIQSRLPAALSSGNMKSDALAISGSTESADRLERTTLAIVTATCDAGSNVTTIIASAISPASVENDQFNGQVMSFDKDTTTPALRGQKTVVTDYDHGTLTFTVTALTTAPVSGDTFTLT